MIALVDMDCFFAQIEQLDNPQWKNKPVAVTNGQLGSTIITSSYQARAFGIHTGMRLKQARQLCPALIQAPSRPQRYAQVSRQIMSSLLAITPDIEVYSVDEAFLDLSRCQQLYFGASDIGQRIKRRVFSVSGLRCSVGISGDRTTAKFAAKKDKPDGMRVIHPALAEQTLAPELVTALSGINKGIASFLARYGIICCGDMKRVPMSVLAKRFGHLGRRIWLMAQGKDPEPLSYNVKPPKTIGHGKVMPPQTRDKNVVLIYFQHMSEKVAARMRCFHYQAECFFIAAKTDQGWLKTKTHAGFYTDDGRVIYQLCQQFLQLYWSGQGVWQVQVTALAPQQGKQLDLFTEDNQQRQQVNTAMDNVNHRYGEFTLAPARLLDKSAMPNVIAPAWKPGPGSPRDYFL
ncbi:ImpB/MucB/SamB family [Methylophaga thiooxydans DMS010]|uniref:ImpB/MucB/SamB family n=2 Tax=Methylophaga thiooxydans TaxID=392484 RepID=C0N4N9_9GAMM|nr:ImpB/MucB/SamB family [Methylophaga thiooxydans DMS010]